MEKDNAAPRKGAIAMCSLGMKGLITCDEPQEVKYPDGNKGKAWTGIQLSDGLIGMPWSSRNPHVIDHLNYEDAQALALKLPWKTESCGQKECWCSTIATDPPIYYDDTEEAYICPSGALPKEFADHIVEIHNQQVKEKHLNLCGSCRFDIPSCGSDIVKFGTGKGNDNVIECDAYKSKV